MADNELINTSVDEYLISLANSINHAQRYISQLRIAGQDGQPSVTYQLPRVEFELKLQFQLDRRHPPSGHLQRNVAKAEGGGFLEARPLSLEAGEMDSATAAAASTIKGSFVAVPIHGGAPPPVVTIAWKRSGDDPRRIAITVSVRSAINEPIDRARGAVQSGQGPGAKAQRALEQGDGCEESAGKHEVAIWRSTDQGQWRGREYPDHRGRLCPSSRCLS